MPVFLFVEVEKQNKNKMHRKHGLATNSATLK